MSVSYVVVVEGLGALDRIDELSRGILVAAQRAVSRATERGHTLSSREIRRQVNFPARYVSKSGGRLAIKKPQGRELSGSITARDRPTSLARFVKGVGKGPGVNVEVKPGRVRYMRRAFLINLRAGTADIETRHNKGLAIRLKPGETIRNKNVALKRMRGNLYLLYGPSIAQVFGGKTGVAENVSDQIAAIMEAEFGRQLDLRSK